MTRPYNKAPSIRNGEFVEFYHANGRKNKGIVLEKSGVHLRGNASQHWKILSNNKLWLVPQTKIRALMNRNR
jgi:hypothetical protein